MSTRWLLIRLLASKSNFVKKYTAKGPTFLISRPLSSGKLDEKWTQNQSQREKRNYNLYLIAAVAMSASLVCVSSVLAVYMWLQSKQNSTRGFCEQAMKKKPREDKELKIQKFKELSRKIGSLVEHYRVCNMMPGIICEVILVCNHFLFPLNQKQCKSWVIRNNSCHQKTYNLHDIEVLQYSAEKQGV